jgi:hypothetical protein
VKLIIREYLASLRERGELDAILPDLLSQMGLNVFSRPGRGTRQDGVDVAAVGKIGGKNTKERVYLFSIKPGDLTRRDWSGGSIQDLRPSLIEILDSYIPNRLPAEHKGKEIVICICVGGDIQEQVRPSVEGFIKRHQKRKIKFEQWNGDRLAALIQDTFLREDFLPTSSRSHLRKSLAMLDEPDTSYAHFAALIAALSQVEKLKGPQRLRAIRQMSISLWILFAWGRDAKNLESPYRSSEFTLLHAWRIVSFHAGKKDKTSQAILSAFISILSAYHQISSEYLDKCVLPHANKRDGLASAVRTTSSLDINLKLFDVLGRLALMGLWLRWSAERYKDEKGANEGLMKGSARCVSALKEMISNNGVLLLPIADSQGIDITIASLLLAVDSRNREDLRTWLSEIVNRAGFAYRVHGRYPATLHSYSELLDHPQRDDDYRRNVTQGSILYPMVALWAALLGFDDVYADVSRLKTELLEHCNFQFWYPDENSEASFYTNSDSHGTTLSDARVNESKEELIKQAFGECDLLPQFNELSAIKFGFWPIIIVACRHYRLPLPLHLFRDFLRVTSGQAENEKKAADDLPATTA